jgi:hypothetical protein
MTICIAAKAKGDYIVVASDRMVTLSLPSTEFEQGSSKTLELTNTCLVATAGSALRYTPIYTNVRNQIQLTNMKDISQIAETNRQLYMQMRNGKMEQSILAAYGLSLQNFYQINQTLSPQILAQVAQAMSLFDYELTILIAGTDDFGSHIYRIDNPARMEIFDSLGHCSVGSGELHSISTFIANDYTVDLDVNHVTALTYQAKRLSEKAQGVGEKSDIYVISKEGYRQLSSDMINKLDLIYNKQSKKDENTIKEIENEIESLNLHKKSS